VKVALMAVLLMCASGCSITNVTVQWPISFGSGDVEADSSSEQDMSPDVKPRVSVAP